MNEQLVWQVVFSKDGYDNMSHHICFSIILPHTCQWVCPPTFTPVGLCDCISLYSMVGQMLYRLGLQRAMHFCLDLLGHTLGTQPVYYEEVQAACEEAYLESNWDPWLKAPTGFPIYIQGPSCHPRE